MGGESLKLQFEQVLGNKQRQIDEIYYIIKVCGIDMYKKRGLTHWKKPYPKDFIKKDCVEKKVFLIKDLDEDIYVHTFQLEFSEVIEVEKKGTATLSKFATLPEYAGQGIGKQSLDFIESMCLEKGVSTLSLEVYDQSEEAVEFYRNRGFKIIKSKPTTNFSVFIMEKDFLLYNL